VAPSSETKWSLPVHGVIMDKLRKLRLSMPAAALGERRWGHRARAICTAVTRGRRRAVRSGIPLRIGNIHAPGSEEDAPGPGDLAEVGGEPQHAPLIIRVGRRSLDSTDKRLDAVLPHVRFL